MASQAIVDLQISVSDAEGIHQDQHQRWRFTPGAALVNGKRETKTLTASTFTALSPPTGAKLAVLILNGATSLTWKGITGDTGTTIAPASNPITKAIALMTLGDTPSVGIANGVASDQVIEIIWL